MRRILPGLMVSGVLAALAGDAEAQNEQPRFELGPRFLLVAAGGEPANDMTGIGLFARYRLGARWSLGFAVDSVSSDFERPYDLLGIRSPTVVDSTADAVMFSGWVEREYGGPDRRLHGFWTAGVGLASPDPEDVSGPTTAGGTFDITAEAGTETLIVLSGGLRWSLGRRLVLETALRVDHHFADWKVTDRVSGRSGTIDDYTAKGAHVGIAYRF